MANISKIKKDILINCIAYLIIFIFFTMITFAFKSIEWKLFASGLALCSLLYLSLATIMRKRISSFEDESLSNLDKSKKKLLFKVEILSNIPVAIVLYVGAIYSISFKGSFLPSYVSVTLLVLPLICLYPPLKKYHRV